MPSLEGSGREGSEQGGTMINIVRLDDNGAVAVPVPKEGEVRIRVVNGKIDINKKPTLVSLGGPSGVGKDHICRMLEEMFGKKVVRVPRATTREMRPGEINGKDYWFLTLEQFNFLVREKSVIGIDDYMEKDEGKNIEEAKYGIWLDKIEEARRENPDKIILIVGGICGVALRKYFPNEEIRLIYLIVDDIETLKKRLRDRGDSEEKIKIKIEKANNEMKTEPEQFDCVIWNENGDAEKVLQQLGRIMHLVS